MRPVILFLPASVLLLLLPACDQVGITKARIDAEFATGLNQSPHPVEIDPALLQSGAVTETHSGSGMTLYQHITVRCPIRIVPADYMRRPLPPVPAYRTTDH